MEKASPTPSKRVWDLMDQIEACLTSRTPVDAATHEAMDRLRSYAVTVLLGFGDEMPGENLEPPLFPSTQLMIQPPQPLAPVPLPSHGGCIGCPGDRPALTAAIS